MNLVDILARELKEWPRGVIAIAQDNGGFAHPYDGMDISFNGETWEGRAKVLIASYSVFMQEADDFGTSIVTRSQWQAAVDALKAGEQVEWSGVGLPPVGAICEVMDDDQVWHLATVKMHGVNFGKDVAIAQAKDAILWCMESHHVRPARTAEQIAEQEHREAVEALAVATDWILTREACEAVLAAGYRKQEVQQ